MVAEAAAVVANGCGPEAVLAVLKKQIACFSPSDRFLSIEAKDESSFQLLRLVPSLLERDGRVATDGLAGSVGAVDHHEALGATLGHPDAEPREGAIPVRDLTALRCRKGFQGAVC